MSNNCLYLSMPNNISLYSQFLWPRYRNINRIPPLLEISINKNQCYLSTVLLWCLRFSYKITWFFKKSHSFVCSNEVLVFSPPFVIRHGFMLNPHRSLTFICHTGSYRFDKMTLWDFFLLFSFLFLIFF